MLHGAVLHEFCQAFGHLAPFKKQIEVGTGWGWKWQSREQSRCWLFFRSWYPYIFQNQTMFIGYCICFMYVEWCFQMICILLSSHFDRINYSLFRWSCF